RQSKQEALCERLCGAALLDSDLSEALGNDQKIRGVSRERVNAAAKEHIRPEDALIVVEGDGERIAKDLECFGPVTVVEPLKKGSEPLKSFA
ncbi:MAG: hypothetical protein AABZ44_05920, partial [Elusimicrobiota bacterium]